MESVRSAPRPVAEMNAGVLMAEVAAALGRTIIVHDEIAFELRQVVVALAGEWTTAKTATG